MSLELIEELIEPRLSEINVRTQEERCCNTRWWIEEGEVIIQEEELEEELELEELENEEGDAVSNRVTLI